MAITSDQVAPGGVKYARKRVTGNYTLTLDDYLVEMANGTTAATFTLPDATICPGQAFILKRYASTDTGNLFIYAEGGRVQNANGTFATNQGVSGSGSFRNVLYVSDGVDWLFCGV